MGTYGTASGLVIVTSSPGEPGKLLGLLDGELQAYFDSDGKIKAAAGKVVLSQYGISLDGTLSSNQMLVWVDDPEISPEGQSLYLALGTFSLAGPGKPSRASIIYSELGIIISCASTGLGISLDPGDGNNVELLNAPRITGLADATADTDALNRQTGDARYAPIAGAHAAVTLATDAQAILNLSTQEIGLVAQPANRVFAGPASGADADPTVRALVAADLPAASESAQGAVELATVGEAATGTDTSRAVTPAGLPLRVIGGGWALKQADGSAPGGNNRGTAAVDMQLTRTAVTQVASGNYAAQVGGVNNTASGTNTAIVGGSINVASGIGAAILGSEAAKADKPFQQAHAAGYFAAVGDAQRSVYVVKVLTADATPTPMDTGGLGLGSDITIADDTAWHFRAEIVAMTADAAGYAAYTVRGLVRRANGTVTVHGVTTETISESDAAWDATAVADDTNKALSIQVTGKAATTIRWVATVYTTEVTFAS